MALNLTSKQTTIKLGPHKGEEMYVMKVDHYSTVGAEKIIWYASETCGIPKASLRQAWEAPYAKSIRLDISDIDKIDFRNPMASSKKLITSLMYVLNK